jgi:hypothetical protein
MRARGVLLAALLLALAVSLTACGGSKESGVTTVVSPAPSPPSQSRSTTVDIRAARRSGVEFKIFPLRVSSIRCQIPRGGPYVPGKMRLDGTCSTEILPYHPPKGIKGGHGTNGIFEVAFTERWHYPTGSKRWWRATFIVMVRHWREVYGVRRTGATPPQSWI